MSRVLITGGAGFIGSHLSEALLREGHEVWVVDDLSTGSLQNIEPLKRHEKFCFYKGTIEDTTLLAKAMEECEVVYHLAAAVGVRLIIESPVRTIETNILGTEEVLKMAARIKAKVIIASSSEVYGKSEKVTFREDQDLILGPTSKSRWSYACSKAMDEFLALAYWKEMKLSVVIARLFNTVGPRQTGQYGMVLPTFVRQALSGEPITVFGDGTQARCFAHVSDVVIALMKLLGKDEAVGQIYNIGNSQEITMNELAERVLGITRSKSKIVHVPYHQAYEEGFEDMVRRVPDLSKIKALIGYEPRKGIDEIIRDVADYCRK
jgi:UDP-glucose 4-epimerase